MSAIRTRAFAIIATGLWIALAAHGGIASAASPADVQVTAMADVETEPDFAILSLVIQEQKDTMTEARGAHDNKLHKVLKALKDAGVKDEAIRVSAPRIYTIQPSNFAGMGSSKKQDGVGVTLTVEIDKPEIPSLANVWTVAEAALDAGAEVKASTEINFMPKSDGGSAVTLSARNAAESRIKAITLATQKARSEAEAAAAGLGMKLGEVTRVNVEECSSGEMVNGINFDALQGKSAEPGADIKKIRVRAKVAVNYQLVP